MSVSGNYSSNFYQAKDLQGQQNQFQEIKKEFQQLGQDLRAGNLSQAQQDYATLSQNAPVSPSTPAGTQSTSPVNDAFNALGQALQSGNLADAQKAFATLQQDLQQVSAQGGHHHHHHHHGGGGTPSAVPASGSSSQLSQDFGALGQALQSGNLAGAQQAFSSMLQDLQQTGGIESNSSASSGNSMANPSVNVTA